MQSTVYQALIHCLIVFFQFQQKVDDSFDTSRLIEEGEVVLKDSIKTTDNYKALYHKIQVRNRLCNRPLFCQTLTENSRLTRSFNVLV